MLPRIKAELTPRGKLRAYIESNLAYMREHRHHMLAAVQILASVSTIEGVPGRETSEVEQSLKDLGAILRRGQQEGEFRKHDARVMAIAIRNAIDGVPAQMTADPKLDLDAYARELVTLFDRATRATSDAAAEGET